MCGLVGMAGNIETKDRAVLRDMLDICQVRGRHSTGVVNINRDQEYGYIKNVGPPAYLFDRRAYTDHIETGTHAAFIGHCRHKTAGQLDIASAHPFDFEDEGIIGVHNGTLRAYHKLDGYHHSKVDSEVLYEHLSLNGPEETFNQIEGAWACVWWDNNDKTMNFIRNDQRPLFFTWSKDLKKLFWASETWMFGAVERKQDLWNGPKDNGEGKYIRLPVDTLWSFTITPNATGANNPTIKFKSAKPIARKEPYTYGGHYKRMSPLDSSRTSSGNKTGGEVIDPFQKTVVEIVDDNLPKHLLPKSEKKPTLKLVQQEKNNTGSSTKQSIIPSNAGSEQQKQLTATKNGASATGLPLLTSSKNSPTTNKKECSSELLKKLRENSQSHSSSRLLTRGVSVRNILGTNYIHDNRTKKEYTEEQFDENTGSICYHCDQPIGSLEEVCEMFGDNRFICNSCVTYPGVLNPSQILN